MLRKLLAGATAAIAAVAFSSIALAAPAYAGGSTDPVPYTITATSLTLPSGSTFGSGSDGNLEYIPLSQYSAGQSKSNPGPGWTVQTVNLHFEDKPGFGGGLFGKSTLPFDPVASDGAFRGTLPTSGYCIIWVQIGGFNEHFGEGGQAPVCSGPPSTPLKDAAAAVTTQAATCTLGETLVLSTPTNATWGTPSLTTGPGDYSVVATATSGHLFADGSATLTFTGHLGGTSTTGCGPAVVTIATAPSATPATCSTPGSLVVPAQDHIVWSGGANGAGPGHYVLVASIAPADAATLTLGTQQTTWIIDVPRGGFNLDGSQMQCVLDQDYVVPTVTAIVACDTVGSISYPTDAATAAKVTYSLRSGNGTTGINVVRATAVAPWLFPDNSTTKDFTFDLGTPTVCPDPPTLADLPVTWSHTDAVCSTDGASFGTITAGTADEAGFVDYTVDGTRVAAGATVRVAPGDHVLIGTPVDPADTVDPAGPQKITVTAATTICATDLKTLALTGVDPTIWVVVAVALLQLGLALVAIRLLRRRGGRHTL